MKYILLILLFFAAIHPSNACDICNGGQDNLIGFLPNPTKHLIGLKYSYSSYRVTHPALSEFWEPEVSSQYFHSTKLMARVKLFNQFMISGSLPYHFRSWSEDGITNQLSGIGDAQLMANYAKVAYLDSTQQNRLVFILGAGAKLPTGEWTSLGEDGNPMPRGFQLGSGSYDFLTSASILLKLKKWGISNECSYQLTSANAHGYKFGNSFQNQLVFFRTLELRNTKFIPQVGGTLFINQKDDENVRYSSIVNESGGEYYGAVLGVDVNYKVVLFGVNYTLPINQNLSDGYLENTQKLNVKLTYLF